ncbi:MAG: PPC domain-containing DNA-binding protein [Nanoarchaeota archaeon]
MEYRLFGKTYVLRLDKGDEIVESLTRFSKDVNIRLATVQGIGATDDATIGRYDTTGKQYYKKELKGDMEIAPLLGNITTMDGEQYLHLHINLGDKENNAWAGHLNKAVVSATFECFISVIEGQVDREKDDEIGLNLMKF